MFMTIDIALMPVRKPTIRTRILFIFERLNLLIHFDRRYENMPPNMNVIPKNRPITYRGIESIMIAWHTDAAAEKVSWKPTVALTTIGSIPRNIKVNIMDVLFPRAKVPPLKPPRKDPRQMAP